MIALPPLIEVPMEPKIGKMYSVRGALWKVVLVQPAYVVAERLMDSMGTTFTRDYWNENAKFGTIGWAITHPDGTYTLSEQEPPDQPGKRMVQILE